MNDVVPVGHEASREQLLTEPYTKVIMPSEDATGNQSPFKNKSSTVVAPSADLTGGNTLPTAHGADNVK